MRPFRESIGGGQQQEGVSGSYSGWILISILNRQTVGKYLKRILWLLIVADWTLGLESKAVPLIAAIMDTRRMERREGVIHLNSSRRRTAASSCLSCPSVLITELFVCWSTAALPFPAFLLFPRKLRDMPSRGAEEEKRIELNNWLTAHAHPLGVTRPPTHNPQFQWRETL